jgi:hypothetical protein
VAIVPINALTELNDKATSIFCRIILRLRYQPATTVSDAWLRVRHASIASLLGTRASTVPNQAVVAPRNVASNVTAIGVNNL